MQELLFQYGLVQPSGPRHIVLLVLLSLRTVVHGAAESMV